MFYAIEIDNIIDRKILLNLDENQKYWQFGIFVWLEAYLKEKGIYASEIIIDEIKEEDNAEKWLDYIYRKEAEQAKKKH